MNRGTFVPNIVEPEFKKILDLFQFKNVSYGSETDLFHNFRNTAKRVFKDDSYDGMYKSLLTYMDKHLVALANKGLQDKEFIERNRDIIVYCLLAMAMYQDREDNKPKKEKQCPGCEGYCVVYMVREFYAVDRVTCPQCKGTGKICSAQQLITVPLLGTIATSATTISGTGQ